MTNKTITLSRELVAEAAIQLKLTGSDDSLAEDLRTALADPVPHAGGDAEQVHTDCRSDEGVTVGLIDTIINCARLFNGRTVTPAVEQAIDDLHSDEDVAKLVDCAHVTRLQAEVERLAATCEGLDRQNDAIALEAGALQSELTKARELVLKLANAGSQSSGFPSQLMREARVYLSNQPTPANKENE